jgi:hypothetical protein
MQWVPRDSDFLDAPPGSLMGPVCAKAAPKGEWKTTVSRPDQSKEKNVGPATPTTAV